MICMLCGAWEWWIVASWARLLASRALSCLAVDPWHRDLPGSAHAVVAALGFM